MVLNVKVPLDHAYLHVALRLAKHMHACYAPRDPCNTFKTPVQHANTQTPAVWTLFFRPSRLSSASIRVAFKRFDGASGSLSATPRAWRERNTRRDTPADGQQPMARYDRLGRRLLLHSGY